MQTEYNINKGMYHCMYHPGASLEPRDVRRKHVCDNIKTFTQLWNNSMK